MSGSRQPSASLYTKLKVYRAVLLITLLYSCETWTVYSRHVHANQLKDIHLSCLRRLLHIRWEDKNPDMEVIERAGIPSVDTLLQRAQVRWAGHVARMPGCWLPKQVLYGKLRQGKWPFGAEETFQRHASKTATKFIFDFRRTNNNKYNGREQ